MPVKFSEETWQGEGKTNSSTGQSGARVHCSRAHLCMAAQSGLRKVHTPALKVIDTVWDETFSMFAFWTAQLDAEGAAQKLLQRQTPTGSGKPEELCAVRAVAHNHEAGQGNTGYSRDRREPPVRWPHSPASAFSLG
jgi:hypothetical protein